MNIDQSSANFAALLVGETPRFDGARRVLDASDAFCAVIDEIDQTVVGTSLHFSTGDCDLALAVQARRVIAVSGTDDPAAKPLVGQVLTAEPQPEHTVLREAIAQLAARAQASGHLSVETGTLEPELTGKTGQLSADALTLPDARPPAPRPVLSADEIVTAFAPLTHAIAAYDHTGVTDTKGDADSLAELDKLAETIDPDHLPEPLTLTRVESAFADGMASAVMTGDACFVVFALEAEQLFDAMDRYSAIVRT